MELQSIIRDLIATNTYVSLPSLGSFVQTYVSAKLTADGNSFLPPRHTVSFDPTRTFNDEVIERHLQEKYSMPRSEAAEAVETFVNDIKTRIDAGKGINFPSVGILKRNDVGQLVLDEAKDIERVSTTFGLTKIESVGKKKAEIEKQRNSTTPIQISEKKVSGGEPTKKVAGTAKVILFGALAAIIVVGVLLTTLIVFVPEFHFWNDKVSQVTPEKEVNKITAEKTEPVEVSEETTKDDLTDQATEKPDIKEAVTVETDKRKALFYEEPQEQDSQTYYIITGSFQKIDNAQAHFQVLTNQGHNPVILEANGLYRVAMSKFSNRNRALRELERLRREKPTESVWLLGL